GAVAKKNGKRSPMSHSYDSDFDRLLDQLRAGQMSAAGSEEILRAAAALDANKALPSEAFKDELEVHLRSYAASNPGRPGLALRSRFWTKKIHRASDGRSRPTLFSVRHVSIGLLTAATLIMAIVGISSSGRATARNFTDLIGITAPERPATVDSSLAGLPPNVHELEKLIGFKLQLPSHLPPDLRLGGVHELPPGRFVGAQLD